MDNEYRRSERPEHNNTKKKKRIRKRALIPLILLVVLIASVLYVFFSYQSGLKIAEENGVEQETFEFNSEDNNDGKKNILLLGADREVDGTQRTDVIMLAQYDFMNKEMKLVSLMRDIYVDIPGFQSYKINSVYSLGGAELLRQTIEQNFGIEVEEYAVVDYDAFESVVDVINKNGIPIDVEKDMSEKIDTELKQGEQQLGGTDLLAYARFRHDAEGDFGRVRRQQQVINALKDEALSVGNMLKLPKITGTAMGHVNTSMSDGELYRMMASFLVRSDKGIETLTVPVENTYQFVDVPHAGNVIDLDFETNSQYIHDFLEGNVEDTEALEPSAEDPAEGE
ncbi:LCP family protein [Salinicoccus hispanicus]|uniref:Regulatory protein MsrR n=1 Tax=Salinicoccus hispanicus TaxID=157225 RepID=A0A6N8TZ80_9STAP|nr:LCP family protein [Salinicoccus hispanicus]MXQ50357.1 LytR family transcriptional regulator [Salinicoccus hispanicus]